MVVGGELFHGVGHFMWFVTVIVFSSYVDRGGAMVEWRGVGIIGW